MKADSFKISKVFSSGGDIQYVLPHFQRQYSWEQRNWQTLLDDAFALYDEYDPEQEPPEHFLGSLVVISDGFRNGVIPAFNLVDGQQRLTTISLLLCALHDLVHETHPAIAKRTKRLLMNPDEMGDVRYKLLPTTKYGDRNAYTALIRGETPLPTESGIPAAYNYLRQQLEQKLTDGEIQPEFLFVVISNCFQVVFIDLNHDESPYKIFESLNAKGKPLSQADVVRNYIAMKLPTRQQEAVFKDHWEKIEHLLQEKRMVGKSRIGELTAFLRHYLAMASRVLCSQDHIYERFRDRCEREFGAANEFIAEIATLRTFAEYYDRLLRPKHETDPDLQKALTRLNQLELSTIYPFLLAAYAAYHSNAISKNELLDLLGVLENYLVRRHICGEPTNFLNKMAPTLWRDIQIEMENNLSFKHALRQVLANKRYPNDRNVLQAIRTRKQYDSGSQEKLCLILESINRHLYAGMGGYTILNGSPTIEHILPQKPDPAWKQDLGDALDTTYRDYLHTLGNLTLVTQEWNTQLSNGSFSNKKSALSRHALKINNDYFSQAIALWDESAILARADNLTQTFLAIWPAFGEANAATKEGYRAPKSVTIYKETLQITDKTWRQFMKIVMEWVIQNHPAKFNDVRKQLETHFCDDLTDKKYPRDWHKLSNDVYVYQSDSARGHKSFCRRILQAVGVSEADWSLEESEMAA
jgi:uncharacterized protein with ParB-like and HNH nuclease domain